MHAFKIWFGHFRHHKTISLLNLAGLAIGMAVFILIALFVQYQLSYDSMFAHGDRIYRLWVHASLGASNELNVPGASAGAGPTMLTETSGVENMVRFWYLDRPEPIRHDTVTFMEENVGWADSTLFDVLSYRLLQGDPKGCLARPQTVILSESAAKRYFGNADPIGGEIVMNNRHHYTVTGVFEDITQPTTMPHFELIASFTSLHLDDNSHFVNNNSYPTFLLLKPGVTPESVEAQIPAMILRRDSDILSALNPEHPEAVFQLHLQPLKDVYLRSPHFDFAFVPQGSMEYVLMFSAIGLFTLLVAILNFINLTTAMAATRARQVGISKSIGADRAQLVRQFLLETLLLSALAMALALLLVALLLPSFRALSTLPLGLHPFQSPWTIPLLAGLVLATGLLAGIYPALYFSGFRPIDVLKGQLRTGRKGSRLRATLVVLQFAVSVSLVAGTLVIQNQLHYLRTRHLGYDRERLLVLSIIDDDLRTHWRAMEHEIEALPGVRKVAPTDGLPNMDYTQTVMHVPDMKGESDVTIWGMYVGEGFFETMGMKMAEGREFERSLSSDSTNAILVNETAAAKYGWKHPLGHTLQAIENINPIRYRDMQVVGVVKDFNFESLRTNIRPMFFRPLSRDPHYLAVRLNPGDIGKTLAEIEQIWKSFGPNVVFNYHFMDDVYDQQYRAEQRTGTLFAGFAGLAILIACLGLVALSIHSAEQRTKEIGVRKVLGASSRGIVLLLARDFLRLVLLANLIAWPLDWYLMHRWLNDFAYHVQVGFWVFAGAGLLTLVIALVSVTSQAVRASLLNPVKALRHE